ncbi:hypothetical protein RI129_002163 [Pyrocoelia pectoralis]|uniref:Uncharacterized protein n=1 Tax=Pyrocoelia pectoralis TaxID=417401 RepID=A0AAN7ZSS5_9COLE
MRIVLLVGLYVFAVTSNEVPQAIRDEGERIISSFKNKCLEETKANPSLVENFESKLVFVEDEALKCYYHCIHKHLDVFNTNGEINAQKFTNKFPMVTSEISLKCLPKTIDKEGCERSFEMVKCAITALAV